MNISFCIITAGKRNEVLEWVITSIHAQQIPCYEIIIAGNYHTRDDAIYVPCEKAAAESRRGELRNVAMEHARYENVMFLDDDCFLHPDFYQKLLLVDFPWDILTPQIRVCDGSRFWDNATINGPRGQIVLDPDDYDPYVYATSGAVLVKCYVTERARWREDLTWYEDVEYSRTCQALGYKISHAHSLLVWHADNSVTLIGRQILRKGQGGEFGWAERVCGAMTVDQCAESARAFLDKGAVTQAADCTRFGLTMDPNHSVLRDVWDHIERRFGGHLEDARWFSYADPDYLNALEQYKIPAPVRCRE